MTTGHVFIATSLDGFIARSNDTLDWLMRYNDPDIDTGYAAFIQSVDGLVMGRKTFETVLGFGAWPYELPVVVLSRTLENRDIPGDLRKRVRVRAGTPDDVMSALADEGWTRAYVDGGAVVRAFLQSGFIADMIITTVPVLIGSGKPLFGALETDVSLTLTGSRIVGSGLVQSTYSVD